MKSYTLEELIVLSGLVDDCDRFDWCLDKVDEGLMVQDSEGLFCPNVGSYKNPNARNT